MKAQKMIVGVDPGKKGAFAFTTGDGTSHTLKVPLIKTEVDDRKLAEIMKDFGSFAEQVIIVLENVHAIPGSSAAGSFQFGRITGMIEAYCYANGYSLIKVQPKKWQQEMHEGVPLITKPAKTAGGKPQKDTKAMSLVAAKRLFPDYTFTKGRATKPDDNIVDAVLIMEYGRRKYL